MSRRRSLPATGAAWCPGSAGPSRRSPATPAASRPCAPVPAWSFDIGGQDSKAILVDELGIVENFAMNDRCASGTGRFFEVLARAIECDIGELADLALSGHRDLEVSSMCATFAETEIISLLARGETREDIAASVHRAVAARTLGLVAQVGRHTP